MTRLDVAQEGRELFADFATGRSHRAEQSREKGRVGRSRSLHARISSFVANTHDDARLDMRRYMWLFEMTSRASAPRVPSPCRP